MTSNIPTPITAPIGTRVIHGVHGTEGIITAWSEDGLTVAVTGAAGGSHVYPSHFGTYRLRRYPDDYCLADIAAYGACILTPGHDGNHKDANGYSFNGIDRKVRR